jgi:hypothetical protein
MKIHAIEAECPACSAPALPARPCDYCGNLVPRVPCWCHEDRMRDPDYKPHFGGGVHYYGMVHTLYTRD